MSFALWLAGLGRKASPSAGRWLAAVVCAAGVILWSGAARAAIIIDDTFTAANGTSSQGWIPDVTDLPGGSWTVGAFYSTQIENDALYIGADQGATIALSSSGSYVRPNVLTISADLQLGTCTYYGMGLGFNSTASLINGAGDDWGTFTGLQLENGGDLAFRQGNNIIASVPWSGAAFSANAYYNLSYTINTATGALSGIQLQGSNANYSSLVTAAGSTYFTPANTLFGNVIAQGGSAGNKGYLDNFMVSSPNSTLTWNGGSGGSAASDGGGTWNGVSTNWWGTAPAAWTDGNQAVFGAGTGNGSAGTVTISGDVKPAGIVFNATGDGNAYTITGGTIDFNGQSQTITAGTRDLAGYGPTVEALNGNGLIGNSTSDFSNLSLLTVSNGGSFSGTIQDGLGAGNAPVSLQLTGGALILSGTDTYTGGTTVIAGALIVTSNTALPGDTNLTVAAGGTLIFNPSAAVAAPVALSAMVPIVPVPEPGALALLVAGMAAGFGVWRVRKGNRVAIRWNGMHSVLRRAGRWLAALALAAAVPAALPVRAATINWSNSYEFENQDGVAADSYAQFIPGTVVDSFTATTNSVTLPLNVSDSVHGRTLGFIKSGSGIDSQGGGGFGGPMPAPTTGDSNLNLVLSNGTQGASGNDSVIVTMPNLTIGNAYQFQVWATGEGWQPTLSGTSGPSGPNYQPVSSADSKAWFVTGTFTADATTQVFEIDKNGVGRPEINAYLVTALSGASSQATWTGTGGGSWATAGSWSTSPNIPGSNYGDTALFSDSIGSGTAAVTLDGYHLLSGLAFDTTLGGGYTLNVGTSGNLTLANTGSASATLSDSGGSHTINVPVNLQSTLAASVTGGSTLTISGPIIGGGNALQLAGGGTLLLSGSNAYAGNTTISGGTLQVGGGGLLSSGGSAATGTYYGNIAVSGSGLLNFTTSANQTLQTGIISGAGGLTQAGAGRLALLAADTYSGATLVSAGTLNAANNSALGFGGAVPINASGPATVSGASAAATLDLAGAATLNKAIYLNGGANGASLVVSSGTTTLGNGIAEIDFTNGGVGVTGSTVTISGGGGGAGAAATFTSSSGSLASITVTAAGSGYTTAPTLAFGAGTGQAATAVLSSLTLTGTNNNLGGAGNLTIAAQITQSAPGAGFTKIGAGMLTLGGSNTFDGGMTINAGVLRVNNDNALGANNLAMTGGTLDMNGDGAAVNALSGTGTIGNSITGPSNGATVTVGNGGNFYGTIQDGGGGAATSLTLTGGTLTLHGANSFSGTTTVSGGLLAIGAAGALPSAAAVNITGGSLDVTGYAQTIGSLAMGTGGALNLNVAKLLTSTSAAAFAGTLNLYGFSGGTAELMSYSSDTGTFSTVTGIAGGYTLAYNPGQLDIVSAVGGPSVWTAAVSGTWSDASKWTGGVPNAAGAAAEIIAPTAAQATITLTSPETVGSLQLGNSAGATAGYTLSGSGGNTLTLNNSTTAATITVANGSHIIDAPVVLDDGLAASISGGTLAFGQADGITGTGPLTLSRTGGILILSGTDAYSGGTAVTAGTLIVTSSTALPGDTSVTVAAGGTLIFNPSAAVAAPLDLSQGAPLVTAVPEPGTLFLLAAALGIAAIHRRSRRPTAFDQKR